VIKLHFLGAAGTVTGSRYLIETDETRLMVDCGLFQGYKQLRLRNWEDPPFAPASISAILLTHAHLDHSGYIPLMVKRGFRGKIYCTQATYELCKLLLRDSARLQEEEAGYLNRHHLSKHPQAMPLYELDDANLALKQFAVIKPQEVLDLGPNISAKWLPNGHILGSCSIDCHVEGRHFLFSGDIGRPQDSIMQTPGIPSQPDYLIVESTYGNRVHEKIQPAEQLKEIINATVHRGGSVLIPSFAVGRAQTLLYLLYQLRQSGQISDFPIYLDSPMSDSATSIYQHFAGGLKLRQDEVDGMIAMTKCIKTPEESKRLNNERWPKVIISASGMATGGRVLHHMKNMAPDDRNAILFCGHQAGGTRGESMVNGAQFVRIHGQDIRIRAKVVKIDGLSAHADSEEIIAWLKHIKNPPLRSFITHGEPAAADALRIKIERELNWACEVPEHLSCYQIESKKIVSCKTAHPALKPG
jgi:metallo-beta-lactamase family protein